MNKKLISLAATSVMVLSQFSGIAAPVLAVEADPAAEAADENNQDSTTPFTGSETTGSEGDSAPAPGENPEENEIPAGPSAQTASPAQTAQADEFQEPTKEFIAEHTKIELIYVKDYVNHYVGTIDMKPEWIVSIWQFDGVPEGTAMYSVLFDGNACLPAGYEADRDNNSFYFLITYDGTNHQWTPQPFIASIYLSKLPDDFNSDLEMPPAPSFEELQKLITVELYDCSGDGIPAQKVPLKKESIMSISEPVLEEGQIPALNLQIDYMQYIPEGMYPFVPDYLSRSASGGINNSSLSIKYDSLNKHWVPAPYPIFYTDQKSDKEPALPDSGILADISIGSAIIQGDQKTGFALKSNAYDLIGPVYDSGWVNGEFINAWSGWVSIENYLSSYTNLPVDLAASNLKAKMVFDPDTKVWVWDGAPLTIVIDEDAPQTPDTPDNPNNPGGSDNSGTDNGNQGGQDNNGSNQNPGGSNNGSGSGTKKTDGKKTGTSSGSPKTSAASGALSFVLSGITAALGMVSLRKIRRDED